jgi:tRNA-dihydrouridine synthase
MLAANRLPAEGAVHSPYLVRTSQESPLSYQLLLTDDRNITRITAALHRLGADAVDLNLGCPAPSVRRAGGGSSLSEDPMRVRHLVAAVRRSTNLPLTAKIRLGETFNEERLRDFCEMLVGEGVDMLTVHARLRAEPFTRKPHWEWVGKVKQWVTVPVVANGSIDSVSSAQRCLNESGADGLMIGRAAARTPWIFALLAREVFGVDLPEPDINLPYIYHGFVEALEQRFRPERRLGRMKEFTHYFAQNYFFGHHLAAGVQSSRTLTEAWERAQSFFQEHDPHGSYGSILPAKVTSSAVD